MANNLTSIIAKLEEKRDAIDRALAALRNVGGHATVRRGPGRPPKSANAAAAVGPKKRILSPEGRQRIIEAVKRRWAEQNKPVAKKRNGLTPEGRKKLSEGMKARWASNNPPKQRSEEPVPEAPVEETATVAAGE